MGFKGQVEVRSPPLCLILKLLCRTFCSGRRAEIQTNVTAALGTLQVLVGLFNVGLGLGRTSTRTGDLSGLSAPYWLGAVYVAAGTASLVAGARSFVTVVGVAVVLNALGCVFAVVGVVLYAIDLAHVSVVWMCAAHAHNADDCTSVAAVAQRLLTGVDVTLLVAALLQLSTCAAVTALGLRAVVCRRKLQNDDDEEDEEPPVTKEVLVFLPEASSNQVDP